MIPVLLLAVLTCVGLITLVLVKPSIEFKGHSYAIYWTVVFLSAMTLILLGLLSPAEVLSGLTADTSVNPVKILVLFLSMTALSIFLDEVGFFRYLASLVLRRAKGSQRTLFLALFLMVSLLTIFTSNDIIILTFTPFICYFSKNAKIDPIPYLFAEFVAANTWSMMLVIGNPTNVYLATANGVDFLQYATVMVLPTLLAGFTSLLVLFLLFRKRLAEPLSPCTEEVHIEERPLLIIGMLHLIACTVLLVLSSYLGFEMWLITLCFAVSLFLCVAICRKITGHNHHELSHSFHRLPWELVPFVLSMFVLVLALDKYKITGVIGSFFGDEGTVWKYGLSSFLTANLINNIPMSVLFSSITRSLGSTARLQGVYAAIIGSNIGAYFTPLGALAGIMWSGILKKHEVKFSFLTYIRYGILISVPALLAALFGLWLVMQP